MCVCVFFSLYSRVYEILEMRRRVGEESTTVTQTTQIFNLCVLIPTVKHTHLKCTVFGETKVTEISFH